MKPEIRPMKPLPVVGRRVALIGAPMDLGSGGKGAAGGPGGLRTAGLGDSLRNRAAQIVDRGDVAGVRNAPGATVDRCHHLHEVAANCRAVRDEVAAALAAGEFPLLLGGDHSLAIGSIAAVARHCAEIGKPLFVLWLDAHADFNTPDTSPTGHIYGMPVAVLSGHGHPALTGLTHARPAVDVTQFTHVGVRSVDPLEEDRIREHGLRVFRMTDVRARGMGAVVDEALEPVRRAGGHLHVSFDIDFLDPSVAPGVGLAEPDGPTFGEASVCMAAIAATGLLGSFDLLELAPHCDPSGDTARRVIDLVAQAI
jgi:arginase